MSLEEAIRLVIESACQAFGGEVFITKMPAIRIQDLAEVMINELAKEFSHSPDDIELRVVGNKPGEKFYEELINEEEIRRAWELKNYFVVLPAYGSIYRKIDYSYTGVIRKSVSQPYNSANYKPLNKEELSQFLHTHNLLKES
jgi:FlaA1/EpsC-like NDP-sugar epimerase